MYDKKLLKFFNNKKIVKHFSKFYNINKYIYELNKEIETLNQQLINNKNNYAFNLIKDLFYAEPQFILNNLKDDNTVIVLYTNEKKYCLS